MNRRSFLQLLLSIPVIRTLQCDDPPPQEPPKTETAEDPYKTLEQLAPELKAWWAHHRTNPKIGPT